MAGRGHDSAADKEGGVPDAGRQAARHAAHRARHGRPAPAARAQGAPTHYARLHCYLTVSVVRIML